MKTTPIEQLAEYFTGPEVAVNSVGLAIPDGPLQLRKRAERFFAVREALGIEGYDSKEDAIEALRKSLKP